MNARLPVLVLLSLLVALAGCGGGSSVPDDASAPSAGNGGTDQPGLSSGPPGRTTQEFDQPAAGPQWQRSVFEPGEVYHYFATNHETGESAEITWEIVAVEGDNVTSDVTFDDGTTTATWRVSGSYWSTLDDIRYSQGQQATATKAIRYLDAGLFRGVGNYEGLPLAQGNRFTIDGTPDRGFRTAVVTGTETYAGVECFAIDQRIPDNGNWDPELQAVDACIAPEVGFPVSTVLVNSTTGDRTFEMSLSSHESG